MCPHQSQSQMHTYTYMQLKEKRRKRYGRRRIKHNISMQDDAQCTLHILRVLNYLVIIILLLTVDMVEQLNSLHSDTLTAYTLCTPSSVLVLPGDTQ